MIYERENEHPHTIGRTGFSILGYLLLINEKESLHQLI
jgi:hypothetical protein